MLIISVGHDANSGQIKLVTIVNSDMKILQQSVEPEFASLVLSEKYSLRFTQIISAESENNNAAWEIYNTLVYGAKLVKVC